MQYTFYILVHLEATSLYLLAMIVICITQYGSTVHIGMAMGGSAL